MSAKNQTRALPHLSVVSSSRKSTHVRSLTENRVNAKRLESVYVKYNGWRFGAMKKFWDDFKNGETFKDMVIYKKSGGDGFGERLRLIEVGKKNKGHIFQSSLNTFISYEEKNLDILEEVDDIERKDWQISDISDFIVTPTVGDKNICFIDDDEFVNPADVGPDYEGLFVSQARLCKFDDLMIALQNYFKAQYEKTKAFMPKFNVPENQYIDEQYVWLDIFSAVQSNDVVKRQQISSNINDGLQSAIKAFDDAAVFLDNATKPAPFTRSWCVWELAAICESELGLKIICSQEILTSLVQQFNPTRALLLKAIRSISSETVTCFNPSDKAMIDTKVKKIKPDGFKTVSHRLEKSYRRWLANQLDSHVNERFNTTPDDAVYNPADVMFLLDVAEFVLFEEQITPSQVQEMKRCALTFITAAHTIVNVKDMFTGDHNDMKFLNEVCKFRREFTETWFSEKYPAMAKGEAIIKKFAEAQEAQEGLKSIEAARAKLWFAKFAALQGKKTEVKGFCSEILDMNRTEDMDLELFHIDEQAEKLLESVL